MKKFLGAFTAIATTFANQAASAVEHKSVQPSLTSKDHIAQSTNLTDPKLAIVDANGDEQLFVLKRAEDTGLLFAGHRSHSSHSSHSSHRSHYSSSE